MNEVEFVGWEGEGHDPVQPRGRDDTPLYKLEWLWIEQAAREAGVRVVDVKRAITEGRLPAEGERRLRIHHADLNEWLHPQ